MKNIRHGAFLIAALVSFVACGIASAQDVQTGVTFVCGGERMLVESCNMRDTSDASTCLVQHPDRPKHNGFVAYTNETRAALKKLIPTCAQPTADQVARVQAFQKKQQDKQDAILQQNLKLMDTPPPAPGSGDTGGSPKAQRDKLRLARCLSAGRSEMQCAGNEFGKAFEGVFAFAGSLIGGVKQPDPGLYMLGTYEGKGGWYIEFSQDIAQMACSDLVNESQDYKIEFQGTKVLVRVENKPAPLVFNLRDGKLYGGSAPVQVAGAIVVGHTAGSGGGSYDSSTPGPSGPTTSTETSSRDVSPMEAQSYQMGGGAGTVTQNGTMDTINTTTTTTNYSSRPAPTPSYNTGPRIITAPRTRSCAAPVLANLHPPQSQDMGSAMSGLAGVFGMDDGGAKKPATVPAGLRMQGDFAVAGGADIDFHSDSAIVACGAIAAQYPYTVDLSGNEPILRLAAGGKPTIDLTFGPDRKTFIGSGTVQVTGRVPTGEDQNGNMAYTQRTVSCALGTFAPVTDDAPVTAVQPVASNSNAAASAAKTAAAYPAFSTPTKPTGTAVLAVASGFPAQAGVANPLGGQAFILLRDPVASVLAKSGATVPAKVSPQEAVHAACAAQKPECKTYLVAISKDAATGLKADATGKAMLPGVPAGTYYLTASTTIGKLVMYWNLKVDLKAGQNSVTLDTHNAVPVN